LLLFDFVVSLSHTHTQPISCNDQTPDKELPLSFSNVLVVAAHPDDIEYSAGGTIAKWIQGGSIVRYVILTNGGE
jgi:hypothetical protein